MNAGGTPHTNEEIARVRDMIKKLDHNKEEETEEIEIA